MNNPIDMIRNFIRYNSPQQLVEKLIMNNTNPIISQLIQKARNGDTKSVEEFARNLYKQQGRDFDKEFSEFMSNFR